VVRRIADDGTLLRGERTINHRQAEIVRRIFGDYAAGRSPRAIAMSLNDEGITVSSESKF
jgi:site-specific DNA recombinase